jgi:hypothetical protein
MEGTITHLVTHIKVTIDQAIRASSGSVPGTVISAELEKQFG